MKISTKTLAQFFFNVLGFTKDEIRKIVINEITQESRRQAHRSVQRVMSRLDVDGVAREKAKAVLREWRFDDKVKDAVQSIIQKNIVISVKKEKE